MAAPDPAKAVPAWVHAYVRVVGRTRWLIIGAWVVLAACGAWKAGEFMDSTLATSEKVGRGGIACVHMYAGGGLSPHNMRREPLANRTHGSWHTADAPLCPPRCSS